MDQSITCPQCSHQFPLTGTLSDQIEKELQKKFQKAQAEKEAQLKSQQEAFLEQKKKLEAEKENMNKKVEQEVESEKKKMWVIAQKKAEEKIQANMDLKVKDLELQTKEQNKKLEEAQKNELELRKKSRELEEQKKNMDLALERKLEEERKRIAEKSQKEADEASRLKIMEKDKQLDMMKKTIEDLKRKSEQGSMQIQGEVQENDLKQILKQQFLHDLIEDVPTGIRGADLVHTVRSNFGQKAGVILWESKNTKTWSDGWIKKLKDDQAAAKADTSILVSQALPEGITSFGRKEGVWIVSYEFVLPLVQSIRFHLLEIGKVKQSLVGRDEKMEVLFSYLSSNQFKNRIENIVLAFQSMKDDLETEKRSLHRIWNKREKEIERVTLNTSGFYGDLQGIVGTSLPSIQSLELPGFEEEGAPTDTPPTLI